MTNLAQLVPLPPISSVNRGLSRLRESVMLELLGVPGDPPQAGEKCGRLTNCKLQGLLQSRRIANLQFRSRAPGAVLDLLEQVFAGRRLRGPSVSRNREPLKLPSSRGRAVICRPKGRGASSARFYSVKPRKSNPRTSEFSGTSVKSF